MKHHRFGVFSFLAIVSLMFLMSAGETPPSGVRWEYGVYEIVEQSMRRPKIAFHWRSPDGDVSAEGHKFRLFRKLGIEATEQTAHELMLWNHLGDQGWEFVAYFTASQRELDRKVSVFRRARN